MEDLAQCAHGQQDDGVDIDGAGQCRDQFRTAAAPQPSPGGAHPSAASVRTSAGVRTVQSYTPDAASA